MKNKHGNIPSPPPSPSYSFAINCLPREQSHFAVPNIITYLNHRPIVEISTARRRSARAFFPLSLFLSLFPTDQKRFGR